MPEAKTIFHADAVSLDNLSRNRLRPTSTERLLRRWSVCRHQSEIVFGVLVIIFCPDDIPGSCFFLGQREIILIASQGALKPVRGRADSTRIRSLGARGKRPNRSGSARTRAAILHGLLLDSGR
jgi:hypothetical protein